MVFQLDVNREWLAGDHLHGYDARTEARVCCIVIHFYKHRGRMVQYENGFRGVLQPSGAIHGVELDVSHDLYPLVLGPPIVHP